MACKYTYGNQVYDNLDDLKIAVKNDLQRSADKEDVGLSAHPVTKIISGAQTGVDMAGLDAGKEIGIPTGGTAAAKFQQSVGEKQKEFKPELANIYGLKEGKVTKRFTQDGRQYDDVYYQRTLDNAQEADGTIWFGNAGSPGGKLTLGKDAQKGKPAPLVNPTSAQEIRNWLNKHNIKTLNVAGNREYTNPGIYDKAKTLLVEALKSNIVDNNNQSNTAEQSTNVKGENISSAGSAFAKELTNPGNSLTVEYNNNIFRNAEHAYQTWKSGTFDEAAFNSTAFIPRGNKPAYKNTNYTTMVEILTAKLVQHPKLVKGIDERGGLAYIQNSTHIVKGDAYWESTGQNKFIQALADAYRAVKNTNDLPIQYRYNIPNANAVQKELKLPSTSEVLAVARNFKMIIGDVQMEDAYGGIVKPYLSKKTADLVNTYFKGGFQHWAGKSPEHIAQHVKLSKELNESMLNDYIKYLQDNGWKKGLEPYTGEIPSDAYSVPTNQNTSSQQSNTTQQSNIRLKDYSNARLPNNKDLPLGIKLSVLTPNGNIKNQSKIWSILKNNFSSDVLDKLNDMLYFNIEGDWLFNHFNRNVIFLKVGEGIIPFYFSSKGTSNKSLTWHPFFGIDKDENWIFKQVYNPQTKTTQIEGWNTVYPKEIKMLNETLDWLSNNFNINNIKMDLITSGSMFNLKRNIFVNQTIVDSENPTTTAAGQITGQSTLPHASDFVAFFLNTVSGKFKIINTIQQIDTKQQPKTEAKITDAEVEAMTDALVEMYPEIEFGVENNPNFVDKEGVFNQQTNIKEGVPELFDSNPELANAVYEALGLKSKLSDIKPKVSITNYRNVTKQDKQNAVNGDIEAQKKWMIEEISEFYEAVDGFNNNTMSIDDVGEEVLGLFRTAQQFPEVKDFINPYIEDVQIALDNINKKEQYDKFKSKKTAKGQAEDMTFDNLFDFVNSFPNSKKQQALQLYSQYLDTIFPDSKVKDIVYHGTKSKDKFNKFERKSELYGFYFTSYEDYSKQYGNNISSIINLVNPKTYGSIDKKEYSKIANLVSKDEFNEYDGINIKNFLGSNEIVVFEPEQIHILGSKQDVQGFKEFQNQQDTLLLNQKTGKDKIIGQADIQARKVLIDAAFKNKPDLASHEFAHFYIAWFRNTPLVQQGIKMYGSEEALVQAIGEQAVVQKGKAWSWWKKFVAWLLNSANDVSDLTKENLRDILTDAFLSRQDLNKQAGTEAGVKLEKNVAVLGGETYLWNENEGMWDPFNRSSPISHTDSEMKRLMQKERDANAAVKNDPVIKPSWQTNTKEQLENRLLNTHKTIALNKANRYNLFASINTNETKRITDKDNLNISAKQKNKGSIVDPLTNLIAAIVMVGSKQGVGNLANVISARALLMFVNAHSNNTFKYSVGADAVKKQAVPIFLTPFGISKQDFQNLGDPNYSFGSLIDGDNRSVMFNSSEQITNEVDAVKNPVAIHLGYSQQNLNLIGYLTSLHITPEKIFTFLGERDSSGINFKSNNVTNKWALYVATNENMFHSGKTYTTEIEHEDYASGYNYTEYRKNQIELANNKLKQQFIADLLKEEANKFVRPDVSVTNYFEDIKNDEGRVVGTKLKYAEIERDGLTNQLLNNKVLKILYYWDLIEQAKQFMKSGKVIIADSHYSKSMNDALLQADSVEEQLNGKDVSVISNSDLRGIIEGDQSIVSGFFSAQSKYKTYFLKYFFGHESIISRYLNDQLKLRYNKTSKEDLERLMNRAYSDLLVNILFKMQIIDPSISQGVFPKDSSGNTLTPEAMLHSKPASSNTKSTVYNIYRTLKQISGTTGKAQVPAKYSGITKSMATALLDILQFQLGVDGNRMASEDKVNKGEVIPADLVKLAEKVSNSATANNYIELFEEVKQLAPELFKEFTMISLYQAGFNNSPYNLFKAMPNTASTNDGIIDATAKATDAYSKFIKNVAKQLKQDSDFTQAELETDLHKEVVDEFLRWYDSQYGHFVAQDKNRAMFNDNTPIYRMYNSKAQKFDLYVIGARGFKETGTKIDNRVAGAKNTVDFTKTVDKKYTPTAATVNDLTSLGVLGEDAKVLMDNGIEVTKLCN